MVRDMWHPLHAERVDLEALDEALGHLRLVLAGEEHPFGDEADLEPADEPSDAADGPSAGTDAAVDGGEDAPRPRNKPPISKPGRRRGWRAPVLQS